MRCGVPSLVVFDRDLALGVGADEGQLAALRSVGVVLDQAMGQIDRQRHERMRFLAGEAEHHALIAGAADVHAGRDVARLGVQIANDLASVGREADGRIDVTDLADRVADEGDPRRRG